MPRERRPRWREVHLWRATFAMTAMAGSFSCTSTDRLDEAPTVHDGGNARDAAAAVDAGSASPMVGDADASLDASNGADASMRSDAATDASTPQVPSQDAGPTCTDSLPPIHQAPARLSEIGLYTDIEAKDVSSALREFTPQFALWSDGADKRRWLYLPECAPTIDSRNMNAWSFPVGTRAFKEFSVDGKRIETRLIHRYGPGPDDFLYAHYLWDDTESDGVLVTADTADADRLDPKGVDYEVPPVGACVRCHGSTEGEAGGLPSRLLGVSAVQLSHDGPGITMRSSSEDGTLTKPLPEGIAVPGNERQRAALGYLHGNCGMCHNDTANGVDFPANPMRLWLKASETHLYDTGLYETTVGIAPLGYSGDCAHRVEPGDPGLASPPSGPVLSCVYERMQKRGSGQMPPLATHRVDPEGLDVVAAWIVALGG